MAKQKANKNNTNKLMYVGLAIAVILSVGMWGGQFTGDATVSVTAAISTSASCSIDDGTITFGTVAASSSNNAATSGTLLIENDGTQVIDVFLAAAKTGDTMFGTSSGSAFTIAAATQSGTLNSSYNSGADVAYAVAAAISEVVDGLVVATATDLLTITPEVDVGGDPTGGAKTNTLTVTCSATS